MATLAEVALGRVLEQTQRVNLSVLEAALDEAVNQDGLASEGARQPEALEILRAVHLLMLAIGTYNEKV